MRCNSSSSREPSRDPCPLHVQATQHGAKLACLLVLLLALVSPDTCWTCLQSCSSCSSELFGHPCPLHLQTPQCGVKLVQDLHCLRFSVFAAQMHKSAACSSPLLPALADLPCLDLVFFCVPYFFEQHAPDRCTVRMPPSPGTTLLACFFCLGL